MVKRLLTLALLFGSFAAFAQSASLKGTVTDKVTGEPVAFAGIQVKDRDAIVAFGQTDFDGKYNISPVDPGTYTIVCSVMNYSTVKMDNVTIHPGKLKVQDFKLNPGEVLDVVTVTAVDPLIQKGKTSEIVSQEEIKNLPYRNVSAIVATTAGVFQQEGSGGFNVRGGRSSSNVVFVDGVKMRGDVNIPRDAILSTEVITGGLPARYGDVTGGVVSTTTRGPAPYYFGSAEMLTSSLFDNYHYNLGALTLGGPLIKKADPKHPDDPKKAKSVVGFLFAAEFQFDNDPSPRALPVYKVNDEKLQNLQNNPLVAASSGFGVLNAADFLTSDDLVTQSYRENVSRNQVRFTGNIKVQTSEMTTLTIGGRFNQTRGNSGNRFQSLMNYDNNREYFSQDWSSYVRFQQRFASEDTSTIKNAYYTIQVDFTRNQGYQRDARHKDNFFEYGYVGKFTTDRRPLYVRGSDTITDPNDPNYGKVMDAWVQAVWQDVGVDFDPSVSTNPILANYTSSYFSFLDNNLITNSAMSLEDIRAGGGLLNGDGPSSVYGLWGNVGGVHGGYSKYLNDQFRITASSAFEIKNHQILVGVEYEQRFDRSWSLGAGGLWTLMRLLQNDAIKELDLNNPIASYNQGVFMDTLSYPRLFDAGKPRTFDYNLRTALGMDENGLDWVDIDSYDPDVFSLDMFSANELLNIGSSQYVAYYGFDYLGNKLTTRPSLTDFYKTNAKGESERLIGAFEPIYMAGYIQDRFEFQDLYFNIGVRVDRFDANQPVLKDPFVLYPTYKVGDLGSTELAGYAVPEGMGDDYVVYVDDLDNPSSIVGYRNNFTWYDMNGNQVEDPKDIADMSGGIKPYLVNPGIEDQKLAVTADQSFADYTPQVTVSPRISFQFPISDEAEFFAHYDILVQRPDPGLNRMNPVSYLQLENGSGGFLSNPDLKPQKTTDYELGFRQKLTDKSALKVSAFYREMRDMMQTLSLTEAYPMTYIAYGNLDFGTVKGYTLAYDLRRVGNVRINANYTLQFADGTGSGANSGAALARTGQPNLRYILPLSYDSRHQVVMNLDYRYGSGKDYNGPVIKNMNIFENAGMNVVLNGNSGTPYSRRITAYGLTESSTPITGSMNGSRLPWSFRMDATFNKVWNFKGEGAKFNSFEVYVQVLNVLNQKNVLGVYAFTGSPNDDGYLSSPQGQNAINFQTNAQAFADLYNVSMANPGFYSLPRRVRIGVRVGL